VFSLQAYTTRESFQPVGDRDSHLLMIPWDLVDSLFVALTVHQTIWRLPLPVPGRETSEPSLAMSKFTAPLCFEITPSSIGTGFGFVTSATPPMTASIMPLLSALNRGRVVGRVRPVELRISRSIHLAHPILAVTE
jgi:hypothetical protein